LIDGPKDGASRQVINLNHLNLLPVVLPKFPRGARSGTVAKKWAAADVDEKFKSTRHSKQIAIREKRRGLTDFERFVVARLKKQVRLMSYCFPLDCLLMVLFREGLR
jgi:large subunit ribosomal protein L14e